MRFNPLVPVPVFGVEHRPVPELYPARAFQEGFDDGELQQVTDENVINKLRQDLLSFRSQGKPWQRTAQFNGYSFWFGHSWRPDRYARPSLKTKLKFSGTYDMNGEIVTTLGEKGIYIDQYL